VSLDSCQESVIHHEQLPGSHVRQGTMKPRTVRQRAHGALLQRSLRRALLLALLLACSPLLSRAASSPQEPVIAAAAKAQHAAQAPLADAGGAAAAHTTNANAAPSCAAIEQQLRQRHGLAFPQGLERDEGSHYCRGVLATSAAPEGPLRSCALLLLFCTAALHIPPFACVIPLTQRSAITASMRCTHRILDQLERLSRAAPWLGGQ